MLETNLILEEFSDEYYCGPPEHKYRNLFAIQSKLLMNGYRRSTDEIRTRLEYLRKTYFTLQQKKRVGCGKKKWAYYDDLHQFFGEGTSTVESTSEEANGEAPPTQSEPK